MQLIIHRGTKEIGGSCLELSNNGTRILFDIGIPLDSDPEKELEKLDIKGLWKDENCEVSAIFITHAHLDHFGLIELVNPQIPIYMSETTYNILKDVYPLTHDKDLSEYNFNIIDKEIQIGDFKVIPHNVDHSIAESLAYEIQINDKKVLYTGDLRFHGRKAYQSKSLAKIKEVDYLIMEGSTLGRTNQVQKTENDIFEELTEVFSKPKLNLITYSTQNLDRFVSVYKACLKTKKTLVIDPYSCYILEKFEHLSSKLPQYYSNNIRVYFCANSITKRLAELGILFKYKEKKISLEEIQKAPEKYIVKDNYVVTEKILKNFELENIQYIHSLWRGYLEKSTHLDILKSRLLHIHTSGHANIQSLQNFVEKLSPKSIIPIHTEHPDMYKELFSAPITLLKDNEVMELF